MKWNLILLRTLKFHRKIAQDKHIICLPQRVPFKYFLQLNTFSFLCRRTNSKFVHDIYFFFQSKTAVYKIGKNDYLHFNRYICNLGLLIRDHNLSSSGEAQKRTHRMIYRAHLKKKDFTWSDVMVRKRKAEFKSSVRPDVVSRTYIFAMRGISKLILVIQILDNSMHLRNFLHLI